MGKNHEANRDNVCKCKTERATQSFAVFENFEMFTEIFDVDEAH